MKITITKETEVEVAKIQISAGVRYWEDGKINGVKDTENGDNMPCVVNGRWCPVIDIETGKILNWEQGKTGNVYYKVCDDGNYKLLDENDNIVVDKNCYVPDFLAIDDSGYGDYIIMTIDENGNIQRWKKNGIQEWSNKKGFQNEKRS